MDTCMLGSLHWQGGTPGLLSSFLFEFYRGVPILIANLCGVQHCIIHSILSRGKIFSTG